MAFADSYTDYALNMRKMDLFPRNTFRNLLRPLERAEMRKEDSILDYEGDNGIFVEDLMKHGLANVFG